MTDTKNKNSSLSLNLKELCKDYGIETLYAFGSRAEEVHRVYQTGRPFNESGYSDVDIAVKLPHGKTMSVRDKSELAMRLEDLLGVTKVDLVSLTEADPFLAVNVIRGERLFTVNERRADEYDLYILRRAGDLIIYERKRIESILNY